MHRMQPLFAEMSIVMDLIIVLIKSLVLPALLVFLMILVLVRIIVLVSFLMISALELKVGLIRILNVVIIFMIFSFQI